MNTRVILFVLGYFLIFLGLFLLAPLLVAVIYDSGSPYELREIISLGATSIPAIGVGYLLRRLFAVDETERLGRREGFAIVTFGWLTAVAVGMLPFLICGVTGSVTDAFFETMSGFTTTGATIFPEVEVIPHGLQFWRCMTQWLGGMGIVVLGVALLPMLGVGGYRLVKAETPGGVTFEPETPRIKDTAKELWRLYLAISAAEVLLLILSGVSVYDAFCHTFTTMSTGGFSPHSESIAYFTSPFTQWIFIVFMFVAGINFSLHAQLFRGKFRPYAQNPEFRLYAIILLFCVILAAFLVPKTTGLEEHIRSCAFQVVSIGTTTGYATANFDAWPQLMRIILVALMFVGGCMGSTGGGMKVARWLIYAKAVSRELQRLIYPRAVLPLRVGDKTLDPAIFSNILTFGIMFFIAFGVGTLTMAACGYDPVTSLSASAAAIGNIGPGLAKVGPTENYAHLPAVAKWVLGFLMLIGRLELYSVLILLTPWAWKR